VKAKSKLHSGSYQSILDDGRKHSMVTDLSPDEGGTDFGPSALEVTVMSLAGCITTIWAIIAANSKVEYRDITAEVDASKPSGEKTITTAKAVVTVHSDDDEKKLERCLDKTMKTCPVGLLFEKAGVEIETELIVE
jgi:putative redox protein